MDKTYKVEGMTCGGCVRSVSNAIGRLSSELEVDVSLDEAQVKVRGEHSPADIESAIKNAGFVFAGALD